MKRSSAILISAGAALALVVAGTAADAAIAGPIDGSGVIYGCYTAKASAGSHTLVLQDVGTTCPKGDTPIQWNQTGPQGPKGDTGATGAQGATGAAGAQGPAGPAGPAGAQGPKGDAGSAGPAGSVGPAGPAGSAGTNGTDGTNGNTLLNGTGAPGNSLGNPGDFYLDTAADVLYGPKDATTGWPANGVSLVGSPGAQGTAGQDGNSVLSSSGAPSGSCNSGDTDIDRATGEYYTCNTDGAWVDTGQNIQPPAPTTLTWTFFDCGAAPAPCSGSSTDSIPAGAVLTPVSGTVNNGACGYTGTITDGGGNTLATVDTNGTTLDVKGADTITAASAGPLNYHLAPGPLCDLGVTVTFVFDVTGASITPPFN